MEEVLSFPVKPETVKVDDIMAFVNYVKVKNISSDYNELIVAELDHDNKIIKVVGKNLITDALSADQYVEERNVTKTEAAEILISLHNRPFTVSFDKVDGTERVIRGRLVKPEPLLGRSMVEDLDKTDNRLRQVDHRTINFLIVNCIKFVVKKKKE